MTTDEPQKGIRGTFGSVLFALAVVGLLIVASRVASPPAPAPAPTPTPTPTVTLPSSTPSPAPVPTPSVPTGPCGPEIDKADGTPWQCTFHDDFSGTTLDLSKWKLLTTRQTGLRGGDDCWVFSPFNAAVLDGTLRLTTREQAKPFVCTALGGRRFLTRYSSATVSTSGIFNQTYGRFEFRAKFPSATVSGSQSSLWMHPYRPKYGKWPASGEIDVGEFYSVRPDRVIPYIHYNAKGEDPTVTSTQCYVKNPDEFHTYTAEWTHRHIAIWYDGRLCLDHKINPAKPLKDSQPFDQPFSIHISQTLGGAQDRVSSATPMPLVTQVDWVRVWK